MATVATRTYGWYMKQPWKQWTWKQRAFAAGLTLLFALVGSVANIVVRGGLGQALVLGISVIILAPALYVITSANFAADRRHEAGDETAFSPMARRSMSRQVAKRNYKG